VGGWGTRDRQTCSLRFTISTTSAGEVAFSVSRGGGSAVDEVSLRPYTSARRPACTGSGSPRGSFQLGARTRGQGRTRALAGRRVPFAQETSGSGSMAPIALGTLVPPPPPPRTKWTRRVPHPVLIGHAASLVQAGRTGDLVDARRIASSSSSGSIVAWAGGRARGETSASGAVMHGVRRTGRRVGASESE
jgi:hypothetical protein